MEAIPQTLDTIPGIGPVFAAGIIAEIGDLARFDYNEAKVASYAGLKWPRSQSADFEAEEPSSLVPAIASFVTTSVKPLRWFDCTPLSTVIYYNRKYQ